MRRSRTPRRPNRRRSAIVAAHAPKQAPVAPVNLARSYSACARIVIQRTPPPHGATPDRFPPTPRRPARRPCAEVAGLTGAFYTPAPYAADVYWDRPTPPRGVYAAVHGQCVERSRYQFRLSQGHRPWRKRGGARDALTGGTAKADRLRARRRQQRYSDACGLFHHSPIRAPTRRTSIRRRLPTATLGGYQAVTGVGLRRRESSERRPDGLSE